jgi:alpha-L-fucosidase
MTINNTGAYNKNDRNFKSAKDLIRTLVEVVSRGGNFLLNVGPEPDGTIQPEFQERLLTMGKWLSVNGESIYGTTYGPIQGLTDVRTTARGRNVYVHVFDWPNEITVPGLPGQVESISLLAGEKPVEFHQNGPSLVMKTAGPQPDPYVTVFRLKMR